MLVLRSHFESHSRALWFQALRVTCILALLLNSCSGWSWSAALRSTYSSKKGHCASGRLSLLCLRKINKKLELEVIALHLEQRASWHWFTKAYPICDPLSFERDVSSPCQKCTLHIPRKLLTGPTVILCKPVWTCFFSFFPHCSHSWLFFPLQERTQKPIKK